MAETDASIYWKALFLYKANPPVNLDLLLGCILVWGIIRKVPSTLPYITEAFKFLICVSYQQIYIHLHTFYYPFYMAQFVSVVNCTVS